MTAGGASLTAPNRSMASLGQGKSSAHESAEPNSLAVRTDVEQRAELIAAEPHVYYVTNHYVKYPMVLVRLSAIDRNALGDLLEKAWRFTSSKKKVRRG